MSPSGNRGAAVAATLLTAWVAWMVLATRYPPFVDWPEHLSGVSIYLRLNAGEPLAHEVYRSTARLLPYTGYRWLSGWLVVGLGDTVGPRVLLAFALALVAWGLWRLVRALDRDPWVAVGAFVLLFDANLWWGFAPQVLATAITTPALAAAIVYLREGGRVRWAAIALAGVASSVTHAHQTGVWSVCVVAFALGLHDVPRTRRIRVLAAVLPGVAFVGAFLVVGGWLDGRAMDDPYTVPGGIAWSWPWKTLKLLLFSAGLSVHGVLPAVVFVVMVLAVSVFPGRPRTDTRPADPASVLLAVATALILVSPTVARGQSIAPRIAPLVTLALLLRAAPHATPLPTLRRAVLALAAVLVLGHHHRRLRQHDAYLAPGMDAVLDAVPMGARVATLVYTRAPEGFGLPVDIHAGGYVSAYRRGVTSFLFTRTGITYGPSVDPRTMLVREVWRPSEQGFQLDPDRYASAWDYVLVLTGPAYPGRPFQRDARLGESWRAVRVVAVPPFELWRVEHPGASR